MSFVFQLNKTFPTTWAWDLLHGFFLAMQCSLLQIIVFCIIVNLLVTFSCPWPFQNVWKGYQRCMSTSRAVVGIKGKILALHDSLSFPWYLSLLFVLSTKREVFFFSFNPFVFGLIPWYFSPFINGFDR